MKNLVFTAIAFTFVSFAPIATDSASAQNAVLADMYGRGVHAYYNGNTTAAAEYLTMAIDNGIQDPRAFYFRGIVAMSTGNSYQAKADWQQGAELEARGQIIGSIGRSLARFQGSDRLQLEEIRQQAKLQYLAQSTARSKQRYGEISAAEDRVLQSVPAPTVPPAAVAPPAPPEADENPFGAGSGDAKVESDDALADAMNDPFADDGAPAAGAPAGEAPVDDPFGGSGGAEDPFGGGGAEDPFGGGGATDDPFGGAEDPFSM